ncbi:MAG TPA: hypothetical protein VKG78_03870 [Opitutaceae bacterium]|nr:hypothetical protein [Opitutaceae bacterium]
MKFINRVFAVILVAGVLSLIWSIVAVRGQAAADNEFHARNVAPHVEATERESAAFDEAFRRQQQGQEVLLPHP